LSGRATLGSIPASGAFGAGPLAIRSAAPGVGPSGSLDAFARALAGALSLKSEITGLGATGRGGCLASASSVDRRTPWGTEVTAAGTACSETAGAAGAVGDAGTTETSCGLSAGWTAPVPSVSGGGGSESWITGGVGETGDATLLRRMKKAPTLAKASPPANAPSTQSILLCDPCTTDGVGPGAESNLPPPKKSRLEAATGLSPETLALLLGTDVGPTSSASSKGLVLFPDAPILSGWLTLRADSTRLPGAGTRGSGSRDFLASPREGDMGNCAAMPSREGAFLCSFSGGGGTATGRGEGTPGVMAGAFATGGAAIAAGVAGTEALTRGAPF
jgi:hypothetical protein